jgi:hypothetical protein
MKRVIALLALAALMSGCTSKNEFGECIGTFDDKKPGLEYKLSVWNTFLAVVFVETIVVPIVVVADEVRCPVTPAATGK